MKTIKILGGVLILLAVLLSACAPAANPAAPANVGGGKAVSDVIFTGVIESMNGEQWVINGQPIKVDQSVLQDGPFNLGDTVKVEASVAEDGSVTAQRVETPSLADLSTPEGTEAPTEAPGTSSAPQPLTFDDSGNEAVGTVEAITDTSITVGGQTFPLAAGVEFKGEILAGSLVKLHFTTNADGTLSVTEIELTDLTQLDNGNSNDDNSNASNSNDNNGNDNSNDDNGNDDDGGNSNDDSDDDNGGSDDNDDDNSNGNGNG